MRLADCWLPVVEQFIGDLDAPQADVADVMSRAKAALDAAQAEARQAGFAEGEIREALFAVVAWIDERAMTHAWTGAAAWRLDSLQHQYFATSRAGVEFFQRLDALPLNADGAREVYGLMLIAGFEGRYAGHSKGELAMLKKNVLDRLTGDTAFPVSAHDALFKTNQGPVPQAWRAGSRRPALALALTICVPLLLLAVLYASYDSLLNPLVDSLLANH